jgi:hypothetical protein
MHFFSHDCCATVGTDIVARQSKADAQTSFDIIASLEVAICRARISVRVNQRQQQNPAILPAIYLRAALAIHLRPM